MKILFSPEYSGTVYTRDPEGKEVMMDTAVMNTAGLVGMLELLFGLHCESLPEHERTARYYDAVCRYMASHPGNVMEASFRTAGLGTARAMLAWRDELRSAGWNRKGAEISGRMAVLAGVEELYSAQEGCDMADRLRIVTDLISSRNLDCHDMDIEIPVMKELMKPSVKALLDVLEAHGASIVQSAGAVSGESNLGRLREFLMKKEGGKITLDKDDPSIQIWKFKDERLACEYLSYMNMEDADVWVNADNKQMDDWLKAMGREQTGSVASDCTPQLTQLFVMGIGLFSDPLNVGTLIEWLNMPVHPLGGLFRSSLADTIVREGAYRNDACRQLIDRYVDGAFVRLDEVQKALPQEEQDRIRRKDRKKRQELVDVFLPPLDACHSVSTDAVRRFVLALSSWARQRALLMSKEPGNEPWVEQLGAVVGMCDAFHILLGTITDETVAYKTIDSWMSSICKTGSFTNAFAERGCRIVVDSPAKIASVSGKTIWIGVDGDEAHPQECSFLYPTEKDHMSCGFMTPWEEKAENSYNERMMLTPLLMTEDQLILVVRERVGGEPAMKHPLIVRLEQKVENFGELVLTPCIGEENRREVDLVDNSGVQAELKFDHADKLKWPDHLSPTSIGTLVEHPFDFLMENLLGITYEGKAQMADVRTTKGNVAHAVIARLFAPREGRRSAAPQEIASRIADEFDMAYDKELEARGAILQLAENRLEERLLREQLRACLDILLEILKDNNLKVTGCESHVECWMGLGLPEAVDRDGNVLDRDMLGFIDMVLEDACGHPVVFDFKWTTWAKGYQAMLADNRSIQLEMYRMMLGRHKGDQVGKVAYFLMPEGHLYSKERFEGSHCTQVDPENTDGIVPQLHRSSLYRKEQIDGGTVETNGIFEDLQYVKDTAQRGLYPLVQTDEGTKKGNFFSKYGLFES